MPTQLDSVWVFTSSALAVLALTVAGRSRRQIQVVGAVLLIPLALIGLVSLRLNLFHPRYILASVPAVILLISLGSDHVARYLSSFLGFSYKLMFIALLIPWLVLHLIALDNYFNNPAFRKSPAWDELGAFLNERVTADDLVIQLSADAAFGYYYYGAADEIALPEDPWQAADDIVAALESAREDYSSIYVVSNANPAWQNSTVVETWMHSHMQPVLMTNASGLAILQFKSWAIPTDDESRLARFGDIVELVDYQFFDDPLPTGELLLWVEWRPLARSEKPLKSFIHVNGAFNPASGTALWAQDDKYPQDGRINSTGLADFDDLSRSVLLAQRCPR